MSEDSAEATNEMDTDQQPKQDDIQQPEDFVDNEKTVKNLDIDPKDLNTSSDYSNISFEENEKSKLEDDKEIEDIGVVPLGKDEIPALTIENPSSIAISQSGQASSTVGELKKVHPRKIEKMTKSEKELGDLCNNMFAKLENYLKGEVANSVEDYALLERMNRSTCFKYQEMMKVATSVSQSMHEINLKFSDLRPYLEQIEQIEQSVLVLEQAAYKLDGYAKRLEERFRKLEKR
ncbi:uncharacterized protein LOC120347454 [Styela clava]